MAIRKLSITEFDINSLKQLSGPAEDNMIYDCMSKIKAYVDHYNKGYGVGSEDEIIREAAKSVITLSIIRSKNTLECLRLFYRMGKTAEFSWAIELALESDANTDRILNLFNKFLS